MDKADLVDTIRAIHPFRLFKGLILVLFMAFAICMLYDIATSNVPIHQSAIIALKAVMFVAVILLLLVGITLGPIRYRKFAAIIYIFMFLFTLAIVFLSFRSIAVGQSPFLGTHYSFYLPLALAFPFLAYCSWQGWEPYFASHNQSGHRRRNIGEASGGK